MMCAKPAAAIRFDEPVAELEAESIEKELEALYTSRNRDAFRRQCLELQKVPLNGHTAGVRRMVHDLGYRMFGGCKFIWDEEDRALVACTLASLEETT